MKMLLVLFASLAVQSGIVSAQTLQTYTFPPTALFSGFAASKNAPLTIPQPKFFPEDLHYSNLITSVSSPSHGTLTLLPNGNYRYQPGPDFSGVDSFTYNAPFYGLAGTGTVTIVDYSAVRGNYFCVTLIDLAKAGRNGNPLQSGTFSVTATGSFTFRDGSLSRAGQLDMQGSFGDTQSRQGGYYTGFTVVYQNGVASISGEYTDGSPTGFTTTPFTGYKIFPAGANAGRYSLLLQLDPSTDRQQGTGWATMNVTASGRITYSGQLYNAQSFSGASAVAANSTFAFYLPGYQNLCTETFRDVPGMSDFDGSATVSLLQYAQPGYELATVKVIGSRFTPGGPGKHLLKYSKPTGTADLTFTGGELPSTLQATAKVAPGEVVTAKTSPLAALTFWSYDSSVFGSVGGIFSGQFKYPGAKSPVGFNGVVFQKQNIAAGVFRGLPPYEGDAIPYGTVLITPQ